MKTFFTLLLMAAAAPVWAAPSATPVTHCNLHLEMENWQESERVFLAAQGGTLNQVQLPVDVASLFAAHRTGYYPDRGDIWEMPATRGVLPLKDGRVSKSRRKTAFELFEKFPNLRVTFNAATAEVIEQCASVERKSEPWMTPAVVSGYQSLAQLGHVFSLELWDGEELVAGNFGLVSNGHVQGVSVFRKKSHPLVDGGGNLLQEAESIYFAQRGFDFLDVEVATVKGAGKQKTHVQPIPASIFSSWLNEKNAVEVVAFEGHVAGQPLPKVDFDLKGIMGRMRFNRDYRYQSVIQP